MNNCSPASVVAMLWVVLLINLIFNSSSNLRMEWLSAEVDTPNCAAALVKLPACAAIKKYLSSFRLFIVL